MDPNNEMPDLYEYYSQLDMNQYTQYCGYLEQLEDTEEDEAESSEKRSRRYIARERELAEEKLRRDYFGDENTPPVYPEEYFRRRYRMSSTLLKKIVNDISNYNVDPLPDYFLFFKQRPDCTGRLGFSCMLKCTSAIRQLAYGTTPDAFDEYLQCAERCSRECLWNFTKCIYILYVEKYLRKPTLEDVQHVYDLHERKHGLPGMLGSIDCMHWEWVKCPKALHGQFKRKDKRYPTIMLEAVADQQLWFWHAYFGVPGSNNDLNVLYGSPLFNDLLAEKDPEAPFQVNGKTYGKRDQETMKFKRVQESARKDIERAFGVLQDQKFDISEYWHMYVPPESISTLLGFDRWRNDIRWRNKELRDRRVHEDLRQDIVEHFFGDSIADTGSLKQLAYISHKTFPSLNFPYGVTFFHEPTGRCSNGRLIIDFLAESLGLPFIPPFINHKGSDSMIALRQGVNYAVAGATALDSSYLKAKGIQNPVTNASLSIELGWFKQSLPSLCKNTSDCRNLIGHSLILVGEIGGKDYNFPIFDKNTLDE
ncbi:ALP1-like protein [Tanacetum coccineum]